MCCYNVAYAHGGQRTWGNKRTVLVVACDTGVLTCWRTPKSIQSNDERRGHSHAPKDFGLAFAIGSGLNLIFVVVEAVYVFLANSTALLADAGHNLGDVLGLVMAWGASALVRQSPTHRYTYGLRSTTILAALANAIFLLVAVGAIAWEAVRR